MPWTLCAADIEAIERATLAAVAPERVEAIEGWLLPMDSGTVGRAHSAVPLHHGAHDAALIPSLRSATGRPACAPFFGCPMCPRSRPGGRCWPRTAFGASSPR